jgi:imidazolonepropionase-like amidohydrolase
MPRLCKRLLPLLFLPPLASAENYALINGHVFDGVDDRLKENVVVFISDGRIERLSRARDADTGGYTVVDLEGNVLMPGLIDAHAHLSTLSEAKILLESGVTTVRTAGVSAYQDVALAEIVRSGALPGPDVVAAGVFVTPDLGETLLADPRLGSLQGGVNTDEELRLLVDVNADRGARVIKTRGTDRAGLPDTDPRQQAYTEHQLRVIVEQAASHGIPVMVHAHGDEGARAAVLAGARSIEHGTYLSDETLALMKERGTWLVPTWITMNQLGQERNNYVLRLRGRHMVAQLDLTIQSAYGMGVPIATGTDARGGMDSVRRVALEMEQYVALGMTNFDALKTATVNGAELLGISESTGRIEEGYEADLILVPANPLEHIEALQDVLMVMSNGQLAVKRIPFGLAGNRP